MRRSRKLRRVSVLISQISNQARKRGTIVQEKMIQKGGNLGYTEKSGMEERATWKQTTTRVRTNAGGEGERDQAVVAGTRRTEWYRVGRRTGWPTFVSGTSTSATGESLGATSCLTSA